MGIAVLGPLQVDGQVNGLSPRDRVVLSALVVRAGEPITTDALADALWGYALPPSWPKVLQGCVVRLRKRLGSGAIQSTANGYRLALTDEELDHRLFERLLERAREALAGGDPARSSYLAQEALQLWRGPALPELEEWEPGRVETVRLEGLRMDAEELLVEGEVAAGHAREVLERARALVAQAPFRERRWALLARALYQSGRQPEALGAITRARTMLMEEFGLDPGRELVELEALLLRQDPSLAPAVGAEVRAACPYRGLLPYEAADAESFFGREDDVAACLRRLRDTGVLAVVGPSGVGKSSLVGAGLVASLVRGGPPVLVTTPGMHPMDSLSGLKPRGRQTLVVDQAEEAVNLCADPAERARYFATLAVHVGSGGQLVLALRADHLGDLAPYPEIARVLEDGLYLLGPMGEAGLRSAIESPARRAGLRLEPGLVDLLVREVEGEPAALPLLSHVLRETWDRREGPTLTVAGYRATGGIRQAVSQTAEALYDAMDAAQRTRLRSLLLRLVLPSEDGDPVRARVPRAKVALDAEHARLVERLVDARLVSIDGETVQIAHEALVRVWPRLRGWLDDDLDGQRLFRHLAGAAEAWDAMGRPESELYRGSRLGRALEWRERATSDLNDVETAFLDASVALSRAEERATETRVARERRSRRRLRGALAGVGLFLVLAVVAGLLAVRAADRAEQEGQDRQAAALADEARRAGAQAPNQENTATGLLLAVETLTLDTSAQSRDSLGAVLTNAGPLDRIRDIAGLAVSVALSPDGRTLAVSMAPDADEPGVHLYDTATLEPVKFPDTRPSSIMRFSPDGRQLAMAVNEWVEDPEARPRLDEQPIQLYDLPGGTLARRQLGGMPAGSAVEYAMDYSDDGGRVAAVVQHYDLRAERFTGLGTAAVWDLAHPSRPRFGVTVPEYALVALNADGSRLYTAMKGDRSLRSYDVESGHLIAATDVPLPRRQDANGLDVSPDGSTISVTTGERILLYDATTLRRRGPEIRGPDPAEGGHYSHDGRFLLTASSDDSVVVWDATTGALVHRFAAPGGVWGTSTAWSLDDRVIYGTPGNAGLMKWRLDDVPGVLTLGDTVPAGAGSASDVTLPAPDGHTLVRFKAGRLRIGDLEGGRETQWSARVGDVSNARWTRDSRWLLTAGAESGLRIWDTATGRQRASRPLRTGTAVQSFSADGKQVYAMDPGGKLVVLDRATLHPVRAGITIGTGVTAMGARGDSLLVLKTDGSFLRLRPRTGDILSQAPPGTLTNAEDLANDLSPDGSLLATSDPDGRMRLLDVRTLEWIGDSGEDAKGIVGFAPDGDQFAALQDDQLRLWDGHSGEYQGSLPLPADATPAFGWLPDSSGAIIVAADGRTWTADTRTDTWTARACTIAGRNLTRAEWVRFFPSRTYHVTCDRWPAGS
jgi:DNA-binding SARP family transcriptional activator/WD40 repeat protein